MKTNLRIMALLLSALLFQGCISLKKRFYNETRKQIADHQSPDNDKITESDIAGLPAPVQRYFRVCGYVGQEKMNNAFITWKDVYLKMSPQKAWKKITCSQFNRVNIPARMDYMKSHIMGIFPFEGSHMYDDESGSMKIVLMKLFTVVDGKGMVFDQSELVTVLSETLFVPSYALQSYITWTSINDSCAKATLCYDNTEVNGLFFFNPDGYCTRFDTDDRYYDNQDGTYAKVKWSAMVDEYQEINGARYASSIRAVWHTDKGAYEYFKGRIAEIRFNLHNSNRLNTHK